MKSKDQIKDRLNNLKSDLKENGDDYTRETYQSKKAEVDTLNWVLENGDF